MESSTSMPQWRGTTIISVRKGNQVVIAGDGQVTLGNVVIKSQARKVRRLAGGHVIAGFAGATLMPLHYLNALKQSLSNIRHNLLELVWNLPKIGAPIVIYDALRP